MHLAGQILRVHVSFICFYFYLNAILPLSDRQDILTEILFKVALNTINQSTSFWTPKYQHDHLWTYFQKTFLQGFCIHVLMYYVYIIWINLKKKLIWFSCINCVYVMANYKIYLVHLYILNECSQFERLFQVDNHVFFFRLSEKIWNSCSYPV